MDKPRSFLSYNIGYVVGIVVALANPSWWEILLIAGVSSGVAAAIESVRSDDQNWEEGWGDE